MPLFGLDAELQKKAEEKYSPERELQAREWLEKVAGEPRSELSFQEWLKDGSILLKAAIALGLSQAKVNASKMAFKQMENINNFLLAMDAVGVRKSEQFQTVDLYEGKNIAAVVDSVWALSRHAHSRGLLKDPSLLLGPKLSTSREVLFTEEQMNAGKGVIGLQMGYTGGANASGVVM
ncbi:Transgelin, partial [Kappamyces sp. JEL0680]